MPEQWRHVVAEEEDGVRLDRLVVGLTGWTRGQVRRAVAAGAVWVDGRRCRLHGRAVATGEALHVLTPNEGREAIGEGGLDLVYEDAALLVVAKPAGLPTQPPPRGGDALSLRVRRHLEQQEAVQRGRGGKVRLGEVHRLDRDASGLVVYGKRADATARLARAFRHRTASRLYLALVRTAIEVRPGPIEAPIARDRPGRMRPHVTGSPARTDVTPLAFDARAQLALVGLKLHSGRTHQARVHLAWAVGAIAGDNLYGDPYPASGRIALHAAELHLPHPEGGARVGWSREPPPDFWELAAGADLPLPEDWARRTEEAEHGS